MSISVFKASTPFLWMEERPVSELMLLRQWLYATFTREGNSANWSWSFSMLVQFLFSNTQATAAVPVPEQRSKTLHPIFENWWMNFIINRIGFWHGFNVTSTSSSVPTFCSFTGVGNEYTFDLDSCGGMLSRLRKVSSLPSSLSTKRPMTRNSQSRPRPPPFWAKMN